MRLPQQQIDRLTRQLQDNCRQFIGVLAMDDLEDIVLNPDEAGTLWYKRRASGWTAFGKLGWYEAYDLVQGVAYMQNRELNDKNPVLETTFPLDGSRFEAVIPPVTRRPVFSLRAKKTGHLSFRDYEEQQVLTNQGDAMNAVAERTNFIASVKGMNHAEILRRAVVARKSVLYVGPTGSGKTTLADAHLYEIGLSTPDDRVVCIEDTPELVCGIPNSVDLLACDGVSMLQCVRIAMRLRPRRIIVGEVRGAEAHALLKAWNTGHPGGIATVHADTARSGLQRLESLVAESTSAPQQNLIAEAVNLVVLIEEEPRLPAGRKVREVIAVTGYDWANKEYICQKL